VAVATGKIDGLVSIVGIFVGVVMYDISFTILNNYVVTDIYKYLYSGNMGFITLPELMNLKPGIVILGITLFALGFFWFGEFMEKKMNKKS